MTTKSFWQIRSQLDALNLITEAFSSIERDDHLEVKPSYYKKGRFGGTAIESRNDPHTYGEHGHAGIDEHVRGLLHSPETNHVLRTAKSYTKENLKKDFDHTEEQPQSSLRKQYVIGKTYDLAASHHPDYKKAVFDDYKHNRPDIVHETRAHDYDSLVEGSYKRVAHETGKQFDHMPVKTQYHEGNLGYHNSGEMLRDIHMHHNLTVYRGGDRHEFLHHVDKETGLNENEKFRAVHDYFGHGIHGNAFGPKGEEIAWNAHKNMYSAGAQPAMTAETRGQNSYVNYTHANLHTQKEIEGLRAGKRAALNAGDVHSANEHDEKLRQAGSKWNYAKQASVALPSAMMHPHFSGDVPHSIAHLLHDPKARENPTYDVNKDHLGLVDLARHHNTTSHLHSGGGILDRENAHEDLRHIASVHGFTSLSHNPFK